MSEMTADEIANELFPMTLAEAIAEMAGNDGRKVDDITHFSVMVGGIRENHPNGSDFRVYFESDHSAWSTVNGGTAWDVEAYVDGESLPWTWAGKADQAEAFEHARLSDRAPFLLRRAA